MLFRDKKWVKCEIHSGGYSASQVACIDVKIVSVLLQGFACEPTTYKKSYSNRHLDGQAYQVVVVKKRDKGLTRKGNQDDLGGAEICQERVRSI